MMKEIYLDELCKLLREHYEIMKDTGISSQEHKHFIEGFMAAARTLHAVYQKELQDCIEKAHFETFGMTVADRQKQQSAPQKSDLLESDIDIPTYKRKGFTLTS